MEYIHYPQSSLCYITHCAQIQVFFIICLKLNNDIATGYKFTQSISGCNTIKYDIIIIKYYQHIVSNIANILHIVGILYLVLPAYCISYYQDTVSHITSILYPILPAYCITYYQHTVSHITSIRCMYQIVLADCIEYFERIFFQTHIITKMIMIIRLYAIIIMISMQISLFL